MTRLEELEQRVLYLEWLCRWMAAQDQVELILAEAGLANDDPDYEALVASYEGEVDALEWVPLVARWVKERGTNGAGKVFHK